VCPASEDWPVSDRDLGNISYYDLSDGGTFQLPLSYFGTTKQTDGFGSFVRDLRVASTLPVFICLEPLKEGIPQQQRDVTLVGVPQAGDSTAPVCPSSNFPSLVIVARRRWLVHGSNCTSHCTSSSLLSTLERESEAATRYHLIKKAKCRANQHHGHWKVGTYKNR
jgi:hypothetical protein